MDYKKSIYNIILEKNGKSYVWNTLSGAFAGLTEDMASCLLAEDCDISLLPDFDTLRKNYFIVPSTFDEYGYVIHRADRIMETEEPETLFFVIAPTLNCNYHCPYCFENQRTSFASMSREVIAGTKNFISTAVKANRRLKYLQVTWFGGDPLLCLSAIEEIGDFLSGLCAERNIVYRASVITNGRFLNQKAVDVLLKSHIVKLQVSFDGTEEQYCEYKKASADDYRATLSNVALAARNGLPVLIRINIRNNDFAPAYRLADLLLGKMNLNGQIKIYPAFVNEGPADGRADLYTKYVPLESSFARYIRDTYSENSYFNKLAFAHGVSCHLSCKNNYCIGPEGELYKCEHHFGQKNYVTGSIFRSNEDSFAARYHRIAAACQREEKCRFCPVFPICMGGCPNSALLGERNFDCGSFLLHLKERQLRTIKGHTEQP